MPVQDGKENLDVLARKSQDMTAAGSSSCCGAHLLLEAVIQDPVHPSEAAVEVQDRQRDVAAPAVVLDDAVPWQAQQSVHEGVMRNPARRRQSSGCDDSSAKRCNCKHRPYGRLATVAQAGQCNCVSGLCTVCRPNTSCKQTT